MKKKDNDKMNHVIFAVSCMMAASVVAYAPDWSMLVEVNGMTNDQFAAFIEFLIFVTETTQDPQQIKNALERIKGVLSNPK